MKNDIDSLPIMALINKTREYLNYIERHILNVQKAWVELKEKCKDMDFVSNNYIHLSIDHAVHEHDLSKLSENEFVQYRKAFYKAEFEPEYDMTEAFRHHWENNPHHWQNWAASPSISIPEPWQIHCVHMIVDWMAMGYALGGTAREFYEGKKGKIKLPEDAVAFIYEIFERLA